MQSAAILPFPPHPHPRGAPPGGFSWRDRILMREWEARARWFGLTRVVAEWDAEQGGFVLVYAEGRPWASYGIGLEAGRFIAWRPGTGATFGTFNGLAEALAAVIADRVRDGMRGQL